MTKEQSSKSKKKNVTPTAEETVAPVEEKKEEKKSGIKVNKKGISFDDVRSQFSFDNNDIYLNNAAMAPIPAVVRQAMVDTVEKMYGNVSFMERELPNIITEARNTVAGFLNASADDVAFTGSTSNAMNLLALRLKRLDKNRTEIVTLQDEFPASTIPFKRLGFKLNFVHPENDNHYETAQIMRKVDNHKTAAVVISLVQYRTGARFDQLADLSQQLAEIGVPLFVNATQAAGLLPLDVSKCQLSGLAFSSHTWMMAGTGAAVLYVPERFRGDGFPPLAGWLSARNPTEFNNHHFFPSKEAKAVEVGGNSVLPLVALQAAIKFMSQWSQVAIRERVLDMTGTLIEGLNGKNARVITPLQRSQQAGIVSVLRSDAAEFVQKLEQKGIHVATRMVDNKDKDTIVRISPHFYNTADEINTLLDNW